MFTPQGFTGSGCNVVVDSQRNRLGNMCLCYTKEATGTSSCASDMQCKLSGGTRVSRSSSFIVPSEESRIAGQTQGHRQGLGQRYYHGEKVQPHPFHMIRGSTNRYRGLPYELNHHSSSNPTPDFRALFKLGSSNSLPLAERFWEHPGALGKPSKLKPPRWRGRISRPSKLVAHRLKVHTFYSQKNQGSARPRVWPRIISPPASLDIMLLAVSDSSDARCRLGAGDPAFFSSPAPPRIPISSFFRLHCHSALGAAPDH
ncbi:uncharacterized protein CLUP02_17038 [Colletotrichum lupini]|uniref:Uncharacterized protein n=1 Tax=Colletotrichum lupini TaxID=145971 RepID=A0A9Q8TAY0_9PEZI|nr:uncharacterized protein CLUP02_17038 [Colletotrichum lupini]UQC91502.1 hypothetical protein CLUP02_17038 [Colletotrichum lupini]